MIEMALRLRAWVYGLGAFGVLVLHQPAKAQAPSQGAPFQSDIYARPGGGPSDLPIATPPSSTFYRDIGLPEVGNYWQEVLRVAPSLPLSS